MICVIALVVFGFLGIFSASHRKIAKEAFDCVFKRVTFRKCTTGLDKRLKSQITGKLMKKKPKTAKFVYKHFEIISWFFTILLIASLAYSAYGGYNYLVYGNCNGEQGGFCIYDVFSSGDGDNLKLCGVPVDPTEISKPNVSNMAYFGPADAELELIQFGCFSCPYTKQAQDDLEKILEKYGDQIKFYYIHFPIPSHEGSREAAIAAECARDQGDFWSYYARLFRTDDLTQDSFMGIAQDLSLDTEIFSACLSSESVNNTVAADIALGEEMGIYGTPTFFIGNETFVGPITYKEFDKIVKRQLGANSK